MLFLFFTDMAQPRNHALRLWSEISIWNYAYRQCTARIKITVVILDTDALVFRRIISYRSLTTGSTGKQLSQGLWEQGKVLKCISKDILNSWNNGRGNAAIASATTGKNHILSFSSVDQWPNCMQIFFFFYLWALHSSWNLIRALLQQTGTRIGGCSVYFPLWPLWEQICILQYPPFK